MAKVAIKNMEQRKLHTKSGNSCAKCKCLLVVENVCVGQNAHIYGEKPGAARYDPTLSSSFVNSEKNLIFLCANCHKIVDTSDSEYPAVRLLEMKIQHEGYVTEKIQKTAPKVGFDELGALINCIAEQYHRNENSTDFILLRIEDKIEKNSLTEAQQYITIGLSMVNQIEDYFNRTPDLRFSTKVTTVVVAKYNELQQQNIPPTDIFTALWEFVKGGKNGYNYNTAALGLVVYFFEKCEVFEK